MRATVEPVQDFAIEPACRFAEHVLSIWEVKYPEDKWPQVAIQAARRCITDKSEEVRNAAADAAYAAYAARAADGAYAAERKWQSQEFRKMLEGE